MSARTRIERADLRAPSRYIRALLAGVLAMALSSAATPAFAWRGGADEVGGTPLSDGAVPSAKAPDIDAAAGILIGPDDRELWSRRGDERRAMASTTKMMTALLAVESGGLDKTVTISKGAASVPYGLGLKAGEKVSAMRLLQLAMVASSNDAAHALGEHVSGSMPAFVDEMNKRAASMGLKDTHFANAHGLDASGHYSSPEDLAKLARTAMAKPVIRRVVAMKAVGLPGHKGRAARTYKSTDKLLGSYRGIEGVKTGFTRDAGYCFVASARRDGITLTAVILGAKNGTARFTQAARLLDWGFANTSDRRLASAGEEATSVPVPSSPDRKVPVVLGKGASARVFDLDGAIERETVLDGPVRLPILKGQRLGEVRIVQGERELARIPALAAVSTISVEETVGAVPVEDYVDRAVAIRSTAVTEPLPAVDPAVPVSQEIDVERRVAAPVAEGDHIGEIVYRQGDAVIARVPIVAAESVEAPGFVDTLRTALTRSWRSIVGGPHMARLELAGF